MRLSLTFSMKNTQINLIFSISIALLFLCGGFPKVILGEPIQKVAYTYGDNFKGWMTSPNKSGKLPVIIYNYDEYFDWAGEKLSKQNGYDIKSFMREFERWGYICIVPLERFHKANAIKGAIKFAEGLPQVDKSNIHIVGLSEGAFLSLLTVDTMPEVASVTLLAPITIHYTGYYSIPEALKKMKFIRQPILYVVGKEDKFWKINITELVYKLLVQEKCRVTYREYFEKRRWFWNPTHAFMTDIYQFISKKQNTTDDLPIKPAIPSNEQEISFAY